MIPTRMLGKTGESVSCIGLGGEGVLRTFGHEREAQAVIDRALELGINYLESARAYAGSESYYGMTLRERRKRIFLASKAHARSAAGAARQLRETLANLQTDWLDLWQVHDLRTDEDLEQVFGPGGAIEAFDRAKRDGQVRFVGVTGHQDPEILCKALSLYDFDTVLMPVNPVEVAWRSFPEKVLPEARRRGLGVIGMKVLCHGLGLRIPGLESVTPWISYALGHEVATVVIGCDTPRQVEENFAAAGEIPLEAEARAALETALAPVARELMYYK
jgi:aryl-alcohol dehydrogenase-like predicted oxidoreductase